MPTRKRADQRTSSRQPIDLLLNKYVKGRPYLCRASNLSRGGLLLHRVFEPASNESFVGLQFQLPHDDRVISCSGRVVYDDGHENAVGVRFTNLAPEHQTLIDTYLQTVAA